MRLSSGAFLDWKRLSRQILTILMSEKYMDAIEKKLNEEVGAPGGENPGGNVIKLYNTLTLRVIKKDLQKGTYKTIESVEEAV
eukprot:CAMPEP_0114575720 /NCGR_PEP_ID=MMETSP0125-20121206/560_1 /TAXON_ID=485358 ORGANISM="Aristerostoma sp., Strain ATCC 50986" /NCGR_SAMPLE_ID=MMETSP0125 /ASSEMBLY_ACC=CAM_ASM_000245 /LENGTH=82 /DNA_ID=CAMNT_0001763673 /DNA_START=3265 /DNA_END=3513 /DNA_ORIENTATION=+